MRKLGTLTSLLHITLRLDLIEVMLAYWNPQYMVFRLGDYDIIPTFLGISGFMRLLYLGNEMVLPGIMGI